MTEPASSKAKQVMDDFLAGIAGSGLSDGDRAMAYQTALKHLMDHLIRREGWLAEEFAGVARSLGAN